VLDVGAGTCAGLELLTGSASEAHGFDADSRLRGLHPQLLDAISLAAIPSKSYDVVTAMDVLEHVVDDFDFLSDLRRIATREVIITTPNGHRSHCQNVAHCREYTIPQFANVFAPDELWTGSPDGHVHITRLLTRHAGAYRVDAVQGPDNLISVPTLPVLEKIPFDYRFNLTVDGEEWPHITAVFRT
jgi:hypothetical protein